MYRRIALFAPLLAALAANGACSDDAVREYEGFCTATHDYQTDGTPDSIETQTYTSEGWLAAVERDNDADGQADARQRYTYDQAGNLLTEEEDLNADGQPEQVITYTRDSDGNATRIETRDGGVVTSSSTYTYHPNGAVASERTDREGDGQWDAEYLYDEEERLLQWGWDTDGDDVADHGHVYVYDGAGVLQTHTLYQDVPFGDPGPNFIETYTYDAEGYLIEIETYGYIPSERVRERTTVEWRANHTEEIWTLDRDDDGTVDAYYRKTYDAAGHVLLHEEDYDGDDVLDLWERSAYDGDLRVTYEGDTDLDGVVDTRSDYEYDHRGNLSRVATDTDSPPDGVPERVQTYSYDKAGNVTKIVEQDVTAGTTSTTTYDYSCW